MVQKRVLIVDDEEDITWGISRSLAKSCDFDVQCVHSGDEALAVLSREHFDLVVSDMRMPGRDGLDLLLEIRKHYPSTKLIMMTAYGSQDIRQEVENRGGFFYIEKPFDIGYLRQIILQALEMDDKGFNGYIDNAGIRELVEFSCARKRDFSLVLTMDGQKGIIYFKDGDIIHAECGDMIGERALFNLLNWSSGTFKIEPNVMKQNRTILRDWRTLLHQSL